MPPQRYEAVSGDSLRTSLNVAATDSQQLNSHDVDDFDSQVASSNHNGLPSSPPPSFRSRDSSPTSRRLLAQDPLSNNANQDLADTFDDGADSDAENDGDDRQRLMRADPNTASTNGSDVGSTPTATLSPPRVERRVTELPAFRPSPRGQAPAPTNDGVFANISAKLNPGEQLEEKPPVIMSHALIKRPLLTCDRLMNKPLLMPLLLTGRPQFSPLACPRTKSTSMASPWAPYSPLSGTA